MSDEMNSLEEINKEELQAACWLAENIVTKHYLCDLEKKEIVPCDDNDDIYISFFPVNRMVYNKDQNSIQKLTNIYAAICGMDINVAMLLQSNGESISLYMGVFEEKDITVVRSHAEFLRQLLSANFPGSEMGKLFNKDEVGDILKRCIANDKKNVVSSVSGIASVRDNGMQDNSGFTQGIENVIDAMQGKPFTALFIANSIGTDQQEAIISEYENLYSRLYPFMSSEISLNESTAEGVSHTLTESITKTVTESTSSALSIGTSKSSTYTEGSSETETNTFGVGGGLGSGITSGIFSGGLLSANYSHGSSRGTMQSTSNTTGVNKTKTGTVGKAKTEAKGKSTATGTSSTETTGKSLSICCQDKTTKRLLDQIDKQLDRMNKSGNYGLFATAAYFMADDIVIAQTAASAYKGLINGELTHVESAPINTWENCNINEKNAEIKKYLCRLQHPIFSLDDINVVTPASMVNGYELAIQIGLPRRSLPGIPVLEMTEFGRNIKSIKEQDESIDLGNLYYMGREESPFKRVQLRKDSLSMHTFITGSTGSGKSNTIYKLLEKIGKEGAKFLVVEPAKGEYKEKIGKIKGVVTYGTNPKIPDTQLLRINPFRFPEHTHVLEHLDRLVEIFNVCWPMYAAMPAILKDAVEKAYVNSGWDLGKSENKYSPELFPTFRDVVREIKLVLEESDYSAENKSNYKGALVTRLNSLTKGINGMIFFADDLKDEELFDENVVVDLSRVGSTETKSLIMGLLVLKLQEHRMEQRTVEERADEKLKHVTVLEEAHNLLRRTSTEQMSESSNLFGKSVEMLANSIAEMRTYGEGFIIADQSPGLLDMSVIRNTNTKIILRLPDFGDRELVGKAAGLNDSQIVELAKLEKGVAAIYQNDWIEPVLCKIDLYTGENVESSNDDKKLEGKPVTVDYKRAEQSLLKWIMTKELYCEGERVDIEDL